MYLIIITLKLYNYLNLFKKGAAVEPNQPGGSTVLDLAKKHELGVLINRPLNAIVDHQIRRLAQYEQEDQEDDLVIEDLRKVFRRDGTNFETTLFPKINLEKEEEKYINDIFSIGKQLNQHWESFQSFVILKIFYYSCLFLILSLDSRLLP